MRFSRRAIATPVGLVLMLALGASCSGTTSSDTSSPAESIADTRADARILSAVWGLNDANKCPTGETGLDNIPVTFNWFIELSTIAVTDFLITRDDGTTAIPTCALQFPPDEANEAQTVNLIGAFGDPAAARPVTVTVVGDLDGHPPLEQNWRAIAPGLSSPIVQIEAGPGISDSWLLTTSMLEGDPNACTVGSTFVRVAWSNGMTAYPTGAEIGDAVVQSYLVVFTLPTGERINVRPLAVADLADHSTDAMDDNMHDLCLPDVPTGAVLSEVDIDAGLLQDPNGDPNPAQHFVVNPDR
jgi:hypothetical protein